MIFIVISRWVWSALIGGCGLPLIFISESWSLCICNCHIYGHQAQLHYPLLCMRTQGRSVMSLKCFTPPSCVTHQDGGCSSSVQLLCVKYKFEKESHYVRMTLFGIFSDSASNCNEVCCRFQSLYYVLL